MVTYVMSALSGGLSGRGIGSNQGNVDSEGRGLARWRSHGLRSRTDPGLGIWLTLSK